MPTDESPSAGASIDAGLLAPVSVGFDAAVGDERVCATLVTAEVALTRAWAEVAVAPAAAADAVSQGWGWQGSGSLCEFDGLPLGELVASSVSGGNPVIPLVGLLRERLPEAARAWVHRGATSQDVLDSALMLVARGAGGRVLAHLARTEETLLAFAERHRDAPAAARTLTQQAVPTTIGLRAANWARGIARAARRLDEILFSLPAQLGGAGGTLASFVEIGGAEAAARLPAAFAEQLDLAAPDAPWHTQRWPVTELGDVLVQAVDALGKMAADVATLSRTEIGELAEGAGGGSSAMPQKRNPARSVLIRSAAIRAPHLTATLHSAAALAVDERPDGAWHAEWPALRELLRLALGASGGAAELAQGLRVDEGAVARNLAETRGLILAERLNLAIGPVVGADRLKAIIAEAAAGADLATLLRGEPALEHTDVDALLDPAAYTGLAGDLVDGAVRAGGGSAGPHADTPPASSPPDRG